MASLAIDYDVLRREVGRELGFSRDPAAWNANQTTDVDDVINAGLRQWYRPPRLPNERSAHQWSFLRPVGSLVLVASVEDYDLPRSFGGLDGDMTFHFSDDVARKGILHVSESHIRNIRQSNTHRNTQYYPRLAAVVPVLSAGLEQARYQLWIWPEPDVSYTITYRYWARQEGLTVNNPIPLGAEEHAETIIASCLAAAESRLNDDAGVRREQYLEQLLASVDFDRRLNIPTSLGYNSNPRGAEDERQQGYIRSSRLTTYEKFPI
jgi:hypothetical protein